MAKRIGLISDVHASPAALRQALEIFARERVDDIICAGDIAGYYDDLEATIAMLQAADCKTVVGNHDQKFLQKPAIPGEESLRRYLQALPQTLEQNIDGCRLLVVHANPPSEQHGGIKLLDRNGELIPQQCQYWRQELAESNFDVLVVGHTHQVFAEKLGPVFVVNPGSSAFNHSCMILSLPQLTVETYALGNRALLKSWNFSMLFD